MSRDSIPKRKVGGAFDRREFLKATGSSAALAALAGCTGGGDGGGDDGGSGGDGGSDGGSSGGSDGGSDGGSQDLTTVNTAAVPVGLPIEIALNHVRDSGGMEELWADKGYDFNIELTFEDVTLYASGQVVLDSFSYVEAARLGAEQDVNTVSLGEIESVIQGLHVKAGGPYDPETTGSVGASIDKVVEEGGTFAIDSWASGSLPYAQIIMRDEYGHDLSQGGDFSVQTTDYGTMPKLMMRDEIDMAIFAGTTAGAPQLEAGDIKPLFWLAPKLRDIGAGVGPLASIVGREEFVREEPEAAISWLDMWNDGIQYIHDNVDELATQPDMQEMLNVENEAQAQWILDLVVKGENGAGGEPLLAEPPVGNSEDNIEAKRSLVSDMEELGQIPSGWDDHLTFMTKDELENL